MLSGEELEHLIAAADDRYRPIFAFAAGTGARLGETLGLKWRSLHLERGTASITHQLDRQGRYVELKTGAQPPDRRATGVARLHAACPQA